MTLKQLNPVYPILISLHCFAHVDGKKLKLYVVYNTNQLKFDTQSTDMKIVPGTAGMPKEPWEQNSETRVLGELQIVVIKITKVWDYVLNSPQKERLASTV